eukprot:gene27068-2302_t
MQKRWDLSNNASAASFSNINSITSPQLATPLSFPKSFKRQDSEPNRSSHPSHSSRIPTKTSLDCQQPRCSEFLGPQRSGSTQGGAAAAAHLRIWNEGPKSSHQLGRGSYLRNSVCKQAISNPIWQQTKKDSENKEKKKRGDGGDTWDGGARTPLRGHGQEMSRSRSSSRKAPARSQIDNLSPQVSLNSTCSDQRSIMQAHDSSMQQQDREDGAANEHLYHMRDDSEEPIRPFSSEGLTKAINLHQAQAVNVDGDDVSGYEVRLVMELCNLGCLSHLRAREKLYRHDGSLDLEVMYGTAVDVANGMKHLHHQSVLHGDLKVSNVLLKSCGDKLNGRKKFIAKVADFGQSIKLRPGEQCVMGSYMGTHQYKSRACCSRQVRVGLAGIVLLEWDLPDGTDLGTPREDVEQVIIEVCKEGKGCISFEVTGRKAFRLNSPESFGFIRICTCTMVGDFEKCRGRQDRIVQGRVANEG